MTRPDLSTDRLNASADDIYAALMEAHAGLNADASADLNARLILLLANLVGDPAAILAAITAAKRDKTKG